MEKTKFLHGYPRNADGSAKQVADHVCGGCGKLDPWSPDSAPAFYSVSDLGRKEFIHQLPRKVRFEAAHYLCLRCKIINCIMTIASFNIDDEKISGNDNIKVCIAADPGARGLVLEQSFDDRVEVFTLPGHASRNDPLWFWPAIGSMPYIARTSSDPSSFELVISWLKQCRSKGNNCPSNIDVALPTRLIDVGHDGAIPRLVLTEGLRGEYLTLSYCWGSAEQKVTTLANLNDRLNVLPLESLCSTHRDAVEITRRLGFKYLWIDAICIVQDDTADWNREAAKMYKIYRDSALTIAASRARDADQTIFSERPTNVLAKTAISLGAYYTSEGNEPIDLLQLKEEKDPDGADLKWYPPDQISFHVAPNLDESTEEAQSHTQSSSFLRFLRVHVLVERLSEDSNGPDAKMGTAALISRCKGFRFMLVRKPVSSHHIYSYGFNKGNDAREFPLEQRAWCFQERILATRIVHYSRDELVWECRCATLCECGAMRTEGGTTTRQEFELKLQAKDPRTRSDSWMELIRRCTSRKIGLQNDRLATMSGLAKVAQHEYGYGQYLAGLWKEFLPDQLLWFTMCGNNSRRAPEYRAPTWSFASVENAEYFTHGFETVFKTERTTLAQVISVECLPATVDPTGIVAGGHITLTGPVRRGVLGIQHNKAQITVGDEAYDMMPDYRIFEPAEDLVPPTDPAEVKQTHPVAVADRVMSGNSKDRLMRGHDKVEVTLMAICNEDRGETRIGDKGQNTLFLLILKSRGWYTAGIDGTLTAHERIGLLELDQPDVPERWLREAQTETITIL